MSDFKKQSLEATDETALDIVRAHGADEQADLVDAWVKAGNIAAVARVAREDDAPAPARKAARRGLNVLKARGLSVPEARHVVRPLAEKIERTLEARMMPPDGSGAAVFTVVARAVGKDVRVVDVVVVEGAGVVRCSGGSLSGGKLREWEKESERTRGFGPVTVDLAWVRSRVAEARKQNAKSGVLLPLELDTFDDLLAGAPEQAPPHPATTLGLELSPADAADRIARSLALHNLPELASYLPTREGLNDLLTKLGERIAQKGGEPSQEDFGKALDEEILAATDRFFTPDVRESLAARMLDAAVSVAARAGKEAAQDVLAVRDATLKAGLITQPPREIPFLTGFFQKAFSALARAGNGRVDIPMPARPQAAEGVPMLSADQLAAVKAAQAESSAGLRPLRALADISAGALRGVRADPLRTARRAADRSRCVAAASRLSSLPIHGAEAIGRNTRSTEQGAGRGRRAAPTVTDRGIRARAARRRGGSRGARRGHQPRRGRAGAGARSPRPARRRGRRSGAGSTASRSASRR